ncbi:MAG: transcriptional repressor [Bacillota bacterium]|nr:transcriptional repressor [Bacillota bacterium]
MIDVLQKLGLRATPQRLAILALLEGNTSHPSAEEIYAQLKPRFPSLSLATVYNTLEALARGGVLQEIDIDPERRRFDPNPAPHCHFRCLRCGRVFDWPGVPPETPRPEDAAGFLIQRASVHLYGLCPDCAPPGNKAPDGDKED